MVELSGIKPPDDERDFQVCDRKLVVSEVVTAALKYLAQPSDESAYPAVDEFFSCRL